MSFEAINSVTAAESAAKAAVAAAEASARQLLQDAEDGEAGIMVFQVTPGEDGAEDYVFVEDDELSDDVFYYWQAERDDYEFADAE